MVGTRGRNDKSSTTCPWVARNGRDDDPCIAIEQLGECRDQAVDSGRIGDPAVLNRHVEVGPHKDPLSSDVDFIKGEEIAAW